MNITINNVNSDIVEALKVLLKPFVNSKDIHITKSYDEETATAIREFEAEEKAGKTKLYQNFAEFKKAMSV